MKSIYTKFFNFLPGPLAVRILLAVLVFLAVVAILFTAVFPPIADTLPYPYGNADVFGGLN